MRSLVDLCCFFKRSSPATQTLLGSSNRITSGPRTMLLPSSVFVVFPGLSLRISSTHWSLETTFLRVNWASRSTWRTPWRSSAAPEHERGFGFLTNWSYLDLTIFHEWILGQVVDMKFQSVQVLGRNFHGASRSFHEIQKSFMRHESPNRCHQSFAGALGASCPGEDADGGLAHPTSHRCSPGAWPIWQGWDIKRLFSFGVQRILGDS